MFKPFKDPLLKRVEKKVSVDMTASDSEEDVPQRPYKKRRIHIVRDSPKNALPTASAAVAAPRKPLLVVKNPTEPKSNESTIADGIEGYYVVLWYDHYPHRLCH
jgi:DNA repair and recombination protein RAD54B